MYADPGTGNYCAVRRTSSSYIPRLCDQPLTVQRTPDMRVQRSRCNNRATAGTTHWDTCPMRHTVLVIVIALSCVFTRVETQNRVSATSNRGSTTRYNLDYSWAGYFIQAKRRYELRRATSAAKILCASHFTGEVIWWYMKHRMHPHFSRCPNSPPRVSVHRQSHTWTEPR